MPFPGPVAAGGPPSQVVVAEAAFRDALDRYKRYRLGEPVAPDHPAIVFEPSGLRFTNARFEFPVVLTSKRLKFALTFAGCAFADPFDAQWARVDSLTLDNCTLNGKFDGAGIHVGGNIDFRKTISLMQIDLAEARIQGDLVLNDAVLSCPTPDPVTRDPAKVRQGVALFCSGIRAHSIRMDGMQCTGRIFLDASQLTGIFKAANATLKLDEDIKLRDFKKWDHMVLSMADSDVHGAIILGEEAWGAPGKPDGFEAFGQVNLSNSRIGGDLVCTNGRFHSAFHNAAAEDFEQRDEEHKTPEAAVLACLNVSQALVEGGVWLDRDFRACGEVRFESSKVDGIFRCAGATMIGALPGCPVKDLERSRRHHGRFALKLDRLEAGSSMELNAGFIAHGCVSLRNVIIRGDLICEGGTFHGLWRHKREHRLGEELERQPEALALSGAEIGGSLFLTRIVNSKADVIGDNPLIRVKGAPARGTFRSYGQVRLRGIRIRRNLHLCGGIFDTMPAPDDREIPENAGPPRQRPLIGWFHSARVEGTTFLIEPDRPAVQFLGSMSFVGMETGGWEDSVECWPECNGQPHGKDAKLELSGLTYKTLRGPMRGEDRLIWLLHQPTSDLSLSPDAPPIPTDLRIFGPHEVGEKIPSFKTQPWEQCANVLHELGYRMEARFLYRIEQRFIRHKTPLKVLQRLWNSILGTFVGHGYRIMFALLWAVWLISLGAIVADWGFQRGYIVPAQAEVIASGAYQRTHVSPEGYPSFRPILFSLDMALPAGSIRQLNYWVTIDQRLVPKPVCSLQVSAGDSYVRVCSGTPKIPDSSPLVKRANVRLQCGLHRLQRWLRPRKSFVVVRRAEKRLGLNAPLFVVSEWICGVFGGLAATGFLYWIFLRKELVPQFNSHGRFSVQDAKDLYSRALYGHRWRKFRTSLKAVLAIMLLPTIAWALYLIDRDIVFSVLTAIERPVENRSGLSIAHLWFVFQTLFGWTLLTAVAIALGSTMFHHRRDRL